MKSQDKIRQLIVAIGMGVLLFTGARPADVVAQQTGPAFQERAMSDSESFRGMERQEASVPLFRVWNLSGREAKEARSHWAVSERGEAVFAAVRGEEVPLLYKRLNRSFDQLSQNISQEASHHSDYIRYGKSHRLHDLWQHLGQLKREQGEIIQRIISLETSLKEQIPENDYKVSVNETRNGPLFSGPGYLSGTFSRWRGFYFLISGGFFLIEAALFFICMALERSGVQVREDFVPCRKAA